MKNLLYLLLFLVACSDDDVITPAPIQQEPPYVGSWELVYYDMQAAPPNIFRSSYTPHNGRPMILRLTNELYNQGKARRYEVINNVTDSLVSNAGGSWIVIENFTLTDSPHFREGGDDTILFDIGDAKVDSISENALILHQIMYKGGLPYLYHYYFKRI